jgi:hypothetical protein
MVSNTGSGTLVVLGASGDPKGVELAGDPVFGLEADTVTGAAIAPNAKTTLKASFSPKKSHAYSGSLKITSNAGTTTVALSGKGT